jgi:GTP-binding protein EngB required for normal cell division
MTGKTNMASEMLCESEKAVIDAAQYVYLTLSNSENELFINHFMQYIQERRHFQLTGVNK